MEQPKQNRTVDMFRAMSEDPEKALGAMLRDRRFYTDGVIPPVLFVAVNGLWNLTAAAIAAAAWALGIAGYRLVRKDNAFHALSGLVGLGVALLLALRSGEASDYFLPSMIMGAVIGGLLLLTVPFMPASTVIAKAIEGKPQEYYGQPRVKRAHMVVTAVWAAMFLGRAGFRWALIEQGRTAELAAQAVFLGLPLTAAVAGMSIAFLRWRLRDEPVPAEPVEPEPVVEPEVVVEPDA